MLLFRRFSSYHCLLHNLGSPIKSAAAANIMRHHRRAAVLAFGDLNPYQGMMRPPLVSFGFSFALSRDTHGFGFPSPGLERGWGRGRKNLNLK